MNNIDNVTSINPLQMIQQRFSLIDLAGEILVIDNEQVERLKKGSLKEIRFYKPKDAKKK